ncbi:glutathione S-transferase [Octadecabacter temperatus]|uniref:Glutathione S-transferase GstB n=1 Tax=Octadecabacter temperatus TaxID=1458307 RepID=A0A0K0Y5U8_9RHOB|nr:glutathione S-transferase family protein [Octadecabacter temperatus]AKS46368.1 Glutathione S-transferase GstB [Octadecabacter temperatus]SIO12696.1 glutathione S-transferase [Octadecabacter temperatus]
MTPVLWGRKSSVNVQKVMWMLAEIGRAYERIDAGFTYGQVGTSTFSQMNPNRRVPVWQDGDFSLWESHAILRHLARSNGPVGYDAVADQWMEFVTSTLQPPFISVFYQTVRLPKETRNKDILEQQSDILNAALAVIESRLSTVDWLNGTEFSTAEIAMGPVMHRIFDIDWDRKDVPAIQRWLHRLRDRPAFQNCVMISYDELRGDLNGFTVTS